MPVYPFQNVNTGNQQADIELRKMARAVQTASPTGIGISRTPTGTIRSSMGNRRRMPIRRGGAVFSGYCDYGIGMPTQLSLAGDTGWVELNVQTGAFSWVAVPVFPPPPHKRYFRSAHIAGDLYV